MRYGWDPDGEYEYLKQNLELSPTVTRRGFVWTDESGLQIHCKYSSSDLVDCNYPFSIGNLLAGNIG